MVDLFDFGHELSEFLLESAVLQCQRQVSRLVSGVALGRECNPGNAPLSLARWRQLRTGLVDLNFVVGHRRSVGG